MLINLYNANTKTEQGSILSQLLVLPEKFILNPPKEFSFVEEINLFFNFWGTATVKKISKVTWFKIKRWCFQNLENQKHYNKEVRQNYFICFIQQRIGFILISNCQSFWLKSHSFWQLFQLRWNWKKVHLEALSMFQNFQNNTQIVKET